MGYNTIISYHINVDEAYQNLTETQGNNFSLHPVPGRCLLRPHLDAHTYAHTCVLCS